jgi:hypothetical protein
MVEETNVAEKNAIPLLTALEMWKLLKAVICPAGIKTFNIIQTKNETQPLRAPT